MPKGIEESIVQGNANGRIIRRIRGTKIQIGMVEYGICVIIGQFIARHTPILE
jgi:hypothetical protein